MAKLAIDGGPKTVTNKLVGWPNFSEEAIAAVEAVMRSGKVNYWTGPKGMEFEKRFAAWQGSKYAISVNSGTSALHVALSSGHWPRRRNDRAQLHFHCRLFGGAGRRHPRFADVNLDDHPSASPQRRW